MVLSVEGVVSYCLTHACIATLWKERCTKEWWEHWCCRVWRLWGKRQRAELGGRIRNGGATDRLWWFGRGEEGQWLYQQKPGWRPRGRAERRFMDGVKEDRKVVGVRSEDTEEIVRWVQMNWWLTHHFGNNAIMLAYKSELLTHLCPYICDCTICKASKCNNLQSVLVHSLCFSERKRVLFCFSFRWSV